MAIRVTQVILQVLHAGKSPAEAPLVVGQYKHNYTAFDMHVVGAYDLEIGVELTGQIAQGNYFLAGFVQHDGSAVQGTYALNAYTQHDAIAGISQGNYTLDVYVQNENAIASAAYSLEALIELEDRKFGHYDLLAYEAEEQVFTSEYELQVYLLAQGYTNGLYDIEVFGDLLMQAVSSYDLLIFEQNENVIGQGNYDLNAWEAREVAVGAHYALLTLQQLNGYLDAEYLLEVHELLEEKFGVHYDLDAYAQLDQFSNATYAINVLSLAEIGIGAHYSLEIYNAFNGFADATAVLNAYQQANGFTDAQYGLDIYLARTGHVDAQYLLDALVAQTGYVNGLYLLDTTQELFTWVVNQETGAPSRYEAFNFDSYAKIGQDYLAAKGDGIFLLGGDDDDGAAIDAIATIGRTDFDEPTMKRVTAAFLGLNSAGQVHLTLRTDQGVTSGPYKLRQSPTASTTERAKFKRGIKSRYWEIDIENVDGGDLQIKSAEFETIVLGEKRRLKK